MPRCLSWNRKLVLPVESTSRPLEHYVSQKLKTQSDRKRVGKANKDNTMEADTSISPYPQSAGIDQLNLGCRRNEQK